MNIYLYKTYDRHNKLNKTLTAVRSVSGTLKNATQLTDVTIDMTGIDDVINTFNYLYIDEFNRYYFVTDIKILSGDLYQIHAHVDVLYTYRELIKGMTVVADRSSNRFNRYLADSKSYRYANTYTIEQEFPDGFNNTSSVHDTKLNYSYILAVAGGE